MSHSKILVTSALPYVNNVPHLGNIICILSADIYTRYQRLQKRDVISVLGTDEHGTTSEVKALEENTTPREVADKYFALHKEIYDWFGFDFDCFGRSSDEENFDITTDVYNNLNKNGFIVKKQTKQFYDEKAGRFLADRFIRGECPHCGFKDAKGDQCDNCGKLLDPEELVNPVSTITKTTPILKDSEHAFIDLPKIQPLLEKWVESRKGNWSHNAQAITKSWLDQGLQPRGITRDLSWGIPVPDMDKKVFYSWFDAPLAYISITKKVREDWKEWWFNDNDVKLVQFMGKDNTSFHTVLFPSFLLGTKQPYTMLDTISVNEYLNYADGKFSKSRGTGVFGDGAMKSGLEADAYRFYLSSVRPETEDTVFEWKDFAQKINNELIANFANLVNRTMSFTNRFFDSKVPQLHSRDIDITPHLKKCADAYEAIQYKEALRHALAASKELNGYFQQNQPWNLVKEDMQKAGNVIANLLQSMIDVTIALDPFIPTLAQKVYAQVGISQPSWDAIGSQHIADGSSINDARVLIQKITQEQLEELITMFSGEKKQFPLDLRVAKITDVTPHPDADKLYIEKLDLGNGETRQIVSGLKDHYAPQELVGKSIILVANLKPAELRGVLSEGMLLAGEDKKKNVRILETKFAKPGDQVLPQGYELISDEITIDEFAKIKLIVQGKRALFEKKVLQTAKEVVTVDLESGTIR